MKLQSGWIFDVRRCMDAEGNLLPPERVPLEALLDPQKLLQAQVHLSEITRMEASIYLYDEASPRPIHPDVAPMRVRSPLCHELNRLEMAGSSRCVHDTWRASLLAMQRREPVIADCVGGRSTLWSCPILLTYHEQTYPKAAITVAAFPLEHFFTNEVLEALFPTGNPALGVSREQARRWAISDEQLSHVRELVRLMAEAFSAEISARYEWAHYCSIVSPSSAEPLSALVERLSQMAHEVNNRLTSIHLHAHLARQLVEAPDVQESLEFVKREARSAIEAVRSLTQYVRQGFSSAKMTMGSRDPSVEKAAESPIGSRSILVVEDERPIAELIARALRAAHYDVDISLDGETALSMIERKQYDLIIADLRMPGIGGRELYERVRQVAPSLVRRMVFLTGDILSEEALVFLRETGSLRLSKPCSLEELLALVKAGLERSESPAS
ncbi:MAG: response regulator [Blastocatellia bacterium]|nr:response regulator [Blastocatellia bacterium]MDW8167489.1 response regulator [Acidobacteriota bacterium]